MDLGTTLALAAVLGLVGLAMLVLLWPNEKSARKVLGKWGIEEPEADEIAVAVRYLRRRRLWYPWLFLLLPVLWKSGSGLPDPGTAGAVGGTLLLGGLLAELFAQRPSRGARREAVLEPRGLVDFAPVWMLIVSGVVELAAFGFSVSRGQWVVLGVSVGAVAVSWLIVLLAVRRPAEGGRRVDLVLRCRSARVALGLGIGTAAVVCWSVNSFATLLGFVISVAALLAIASPPRRLPTIATRAG